MEGMTGHRPFWRGKRVLVTGHTGFKGSWLCLWLHSLGAEVLGYSSGVPTQPSLFDTAGVGALVSSVEGDVADFATLRAAVEAHRPHVVFHLAAQSLVRHSYWEPLETFRTNVMGTVHVLEAVRSMTTTQVVVNVTTDKCYRDRGGERGYREVDELGGHDPYSASKACAELATAAYRSSFYGPAGAHPAAVATVRGGNVVGGGDWSPDRLVPDAVRAVLAGRPLVVRNPGGIRPWQHVLDCLGGYLVTAERLWDEPELAGPWNFGPDDASVRPVAWVVEQLRMLWRDRLEWRHEPAPDQLHETAALRLDSSQARSRLGWRPRLSLPAALSLTVDVYRAHEARDDVRGTCLGQLEEYGRLDAAATEPSLVE